LPCPEGSWLGTLKDESKRFIERAGNFVLIVAREHRRTGIGTMLLENAAARWHLNFEQQDYTLSGARLVEKSLRKNVSDREEA
jgi:GNAT superfamily N-acetyltransferase